MIKLQVYNDNIIENKVKIPVYEFKSTHRINILGGDSGTGKTLFCKNLELAIDNQNGWSFQCNKKIVFLRVSNFDDYYDREDALFIWDENVNQQFFKEKLIKFVQESKGCFIVSDRSLGSLESILDDNTTASYTIKKLDTKVYDSLVRYSIEEVIKS